MLSPVHLLHQADTASPQNTLTLVLWWWGPAETTIWAGWAAANEKQSTHNNNSYQACPPMKRAKRFVQTASEDRRQGCACLLSLGRGRSRLRQPCAWQVKLVTIRQVTPVTVWQAGERWHRRLLKVLRPRTEYSARMLSALATVSRRPATFSTRGPGSSFGVSSYHIPLM